MGTCCPARTSPLGDSGKGGIAHPLPAEGCRTEMGYSCTCGVWQGCKDSCSKHFGEHCLPWDHTCVRLGSGPCNTHRLFVYVN